MRTPRNRSARAARFREEPDVAARPAEDDLPRGVPESVSRSLWRAAAWTGVMAAVLGAALGIAVSVVCWLPQAGTAGHPMSAVRAGLIAFLAAQHGGATIDGVAMALVPLGTTAIAGFLLWRAARTLLDVARRLGERRTGALVGAAAVQAGCYAVACLVMVPFAALGSTSVPFLPTGAAAAILAGCVGAGTLACSTPLRERVRGRLGERAVRGLRGAGYAITAYLGGGALLVAGSLVLHAGRVMDLCRLVGGGIAGFPILLLTLLTVPNGVVAGAAYLAGPGFAVGAGTSVDPFTTSHGTLPAFPLLGALPDGHGANVVTLGWLALTVLAAGLAVARVVTAGGPGDAVRAAGVAAAASGAAMAVLAWLGGGAAGAHRLHTVGASPWQVGLAVAGEVAAISLLALGGWLLWRYFRRPAEHAVDDAADLVGAPR